MAREVAEFLIAVGAILLISLAVEYVGKRTFLPRVTLLLLLGVVIGADGLDVIPEALTGNFDTITSVALLMIGFLLGGKLSAPSLRLHGTQVVAISLSAALITALLVGGAVALTGLPLGVAILVGCIASATDPVAIYDTISETGAANAFTDLVLAVVALDDAWGLMLFSVGLAVVSALNGADGGTYLVHALADIGGAIVLGVLLGVPAANLSGRIKPGEPRLIEALGLVMVCGGLALWFGVSHIIAAMVMGAVIANLADHHDYPFHAIEDIELPFLIIFFVLAGASLEVRAVQAVGAVGLAYIASRMAGKVAGAWLGGRLTGVDSRHRRWVGMALMPQAGVAIGMALIAANRFPEYRQLLLSVAISTTVLFELFGPVLTRATIRRAAVDGARPGAGLP
ncbi:MAG: cation:proton antiporter [Gammaproteobacteria bacterium]|nr:cation:proton antiporter [Gammaproteobacteria bacterium]